MDRKKIKMNKNILVSFLLIASVLLVAGSISAAEADIASIDNVYVDGVSVTELAEAVDPLSVIAGDTIEVKVVFTADVDASNVKMKVTLEGENDDVVATTSKFDVEDGGNTYVRKLTLKVPSELKDDVSGHVDLVVKIWNSEYATEDNYVLHVQRPSYDFSIKSVTTSNAIVAGTTMPVEVVLKNVGYNDADDVYVTVSIPELNIKQSGYLGDLVSLEDKVCKIGYNDDDELVTSVDCSDEDDTDTASAKLNLDVPYNAKSGVYTVVVEVKNDETTNTVKKEVTIENGVSDIALKSGNDLVVLNPTNQLKVYTVKYNEEAVTVVVPAGESKNVAIAVPTGDYKFDVVVYSGETVLSTVEFSGSNQEAGVKLTSPVLVLTVILSIVFLVLLVVLVVLITKKPQKTEEFGESYY